MLHFLNWVFSPSVDIVDGKKTDFVDAGCSLPRLVVVKVSQRDAEALKNPWTERPPTHLGHSQIAMRTYVPSKLSSTGSTEIHIRALEAFEVTQM
eukprot:7562083-Pyramimonas_sp.AAC.1